MAKDASLLNGPKNHVLLAYIIIATSFFYMMAIYIMKIILPYIAFNIGLSDVLVSRILYIGFLCFTLTPIAGYITNSLGYRRTIIIASIVESLCILLFIWARSYHSLFTVRFIQAFFGVLLSASFLHLASYYAKRSGAYIGFLRGAQALGMAFGSLVVIVLCGVPFNYLIMLASIFCLTPISAILIKDEPPKESFNVRKVRSSILRRDLLPYYIFALTEILSVAILFSFFNVFLIEEFALELRTYAIIMLTAVSLFAISSVIAGRLVDRHPMTCGVFGACGIAISLSLILILNGLIELIFAFLLFEVVSAFAYNPLYIVVSKRVSEDVRGFAINFADFLVNLSFLTLPLIEILAKNVNLKFPVVIGLVLAILSILISVIWIFRGKI